MKKNLSYREILFLSSILGFLITLATISWLSSKGAESLLASNQVRQSKTFEIQIDGEIKNPGAYTLHSKITLKDLLKKAKPLRYADLSGFNLYQVLSESAHLVIPKLSSIQIFLEIEGISTIALDMPLRSRFYELRDQEELKSVQVEGDFYKSRRLLRHGEKIHFPRIKQEK